MLALDWAKTFDSLDPAALQAALLRFGCPEPFVDMVRAIYTSRSFVVSDGGVLSSHHTQHNGIAQGCPLSPFLFIIVMTLLLKDAQQLMRTSGSSVHLSLTELVYADDTLLLSCSDEFLQEYMLAIHQAGQEYGLSFNWSKLEVLSVRKTCSIFTPGGCPISSKEAMVYLGSSISADGRNSSDINRRLGMAKADYMALARVWGHSTLSRNRKLEIFQACIVSTLTYGLMVMCLCQAEHRRIDGCYCRCLRRTLGVRPAYLSRISNHTVLQMAQREPLSLILRRQRMLYLGDVARRDATDAVRGVLFDSQSSEFKQLQAIRRRGRPRET